MPLPAQLNRGAKWVLIFRRGRGVRKRKWLASCSRKSTMANNGRCACPGHHLPTQGLGLAHSCGLLPGARPLPSLTAAAVCSLMASVCATAISSVTRIQRSQASSPATTPAACSSVRYVLIAVRSASLPALGCVAQAVAPGMAASRRSHSSNSPNAWSRMAGGVLWSRTLTAGVHRAEAQDSKGGGIQGCTFGVEAHRSSGATTGESNFSAWVTPTIIGAQRLGRRHMKKSRS